jgi:hypothetical protein
VRARLDRIHPATLLAAAAMFVSGVLLLHWLSHLTFWRDEWEFLLHRRAWSPSAILDPWVEELLAIPVLIYKVLLGVFGMDSAAPFQFAAVLLFLASMAVLFVYVRGRARPWLGLAAILPILFLGPAWDDLLFPFQMALFGSIACGVGAFLALERDDRPGEIAAILLLIGSLFFFDLGIAFVAALTLEIALRGDRFRRAYVVVVPTVVWFIWYAGWGHQAQTNISLDNFTRLPSYVFDGLASSLSTALGLNLTIGGLQNSPLDWGRPLLVLAIVLVGWRLYQLRPPTARMLSTLAVLLGFWSLTALNASPLALPTAGRYQYIGLVLLMLVAAELVRGLALGRWATVGIVAVAGAAAVINGSQLRLWAHTLQQFSEGEKGGLGALEIDRDRVAPGFQLTEQNANVDYLGLLDAGSYLSAVDAYGSPAYTEPELRGAPEVAQVAADKVFASILGLRLSPTAPAAGQSCLSARLASGPAQLPVPSTGLVVTAKSGSVEAALRRYASDQFPVKLATLPPGQPRQLRIQADGSQQPWTLQLSGQGAVTVCRESG